MDKQDLANQVSEIFERLQGLIMPVKPENVEIMAQTFGQLRYIFNALTAEEEKQGGAAEDVQC